MVQEKMCQQKEYLWGRKTCRGKRIRAPFPVALDAAIQSVMASNMFGQKFGMRKCLAAFAANTRVAFHVLKQICPLVESSRAIGLTTDVAKILYFPQRKRRVRVRMTCCCVHQDKQNLPECMLLLCFANWLEETKLHSQPSTSHGYGLLPVWLHMCVRS